MSILHSALCIEIGSPWSDPCTVAGFRQSEPNPRLIALGRDILAHDGYLRVLDIGCGAARNALPLAGLGADVLGVDLSRPMLASALDRAAEAGSRRVHVALARMDRLPVPSRRFNLVVAHGIWNLARTGADFRRALREAAHAAAPAARAFVFTFSRNTLPATAEPVPGESFVFTQFSGEPQCFLTADELEIEMRDAGFEPDPAYPLLEHNRPPPGALIVSSGPVIHEGTFRRLA